MAAVLLFRERDDLVAHVAILKTRYEEMRSREEDMYLQMKAGSEMVEQSQLEMTQVCYWFEIIYYRCPF